MKDNKFGELFVEFKNDIYNAGDKVCWNVYLIVKSQFTSKKFLMKVIRKEHVEWLDLENKQKT